MNQNTHNPSNDLIMGALAPVLAMEPPIVGAIFQEFFKDGRIYPQNVGFAYAVFRQLASAAKVVGQTPSREEMLAAVNALPDTDPVGGTRFNAAAKGEVRAYIEAMRAWPPSPVRASA